MRPTKLLLALLLSSCQLVPAYGCGGALIPIIHEVATVVAEVTGAIDAVEAAVHSRADADPALVARADDAIKKARALVEVVRASAKTAKSASDGNYVAAVKALLDAYDSLTDAAAAFGVQQAPLAQRSRLGAGGSDRTLVSTTDELRADLLRDGGG